MTETRGSTATPERGRPDAEGAEKRSLPARIALFYRQVVAELRKVIWPTRRELVTYTTVVLVFVTVMIAIVAAMDLAFSQVVLRVFGDG